MQLYFNSNIFIENMQSNIYLKSLHYLDVLAALKTDDGHRCLTESHYT